MPTAAFARSWNGSSLHHDPEGLVLTGIQVAGEAKFVSKPPIYIYCQGCKAAAWMIYINPEDTTAGTAFRSIGWQADTDAGPWFCMDCVIPSVAPSTRRDGS